MIGTDSPPPTPSPSQTDVVIERIKAMIMSGVLAAGSRLPIEKELSLELSVSRGSLREGVRALAMMGVLETRQGDGTYVTSLAPNRLLAPMGFMVDLQTAANSAHIQSVRRVLETEAAARAATRISEEQLERAAEILDLVEPHLDSTTLDTDKTIEVDIEFHRIIATASNNPTLEALIGVLAGRTPCAGHDSGAVHDSHREHRAILAALTVHDPDRARIRMSSHLLEVEERLNTLDGQHLNDESERR